MERYLTDTWHAAEALGREEGREGGCALSLLPTFSAPCMHADRWQRHAPTTHPESFSQNYPNLKGLDTREGAVCGRNRVSR